MPDRYFALQRIEPQVGRYYLDQHNCLFYVSRLIHGTYYAHMFNGLVYLETHLEYEHVDGILPARELGYTNSVLIAEVDPVCKIEDQHDFLERATDLI